MASAPETSVKPPQRCAPQTPPDMAFQDAAACQFLLEGILEQSPYATWISDSTGTLIRLNRACRELLNITEDEVVGKYNILEDNIVREQGFLDLVLGVFEKGDNARFEIRYDSSTLDSLELERHAFVILDVTVFPIKDAQGRVTNAVIQHIDITRRREAEEALRRANLELDARVQERTAELNAAYQTLVQEVTERKLAQEEAARSDKALRESEALFRTLCAFAPIGIFMTDRRGSVIYSNPRWQEISGLRQEQALGGGWIAAVHPDDRDQALWAWREAVGAGAEFRNECRMMVQGTTIWVRGVAGPYRDPDGSIAGYVGTVEDVTEERRSQDERLRNQKLESLGVLAGGLAHDFNNILTIILGYLSLGRTQCKNPDHLLTHLEEAEKGVLRARDLTKQLLTFARGGDPVKKPLFLNQLLGEAVQFSSRGSKVRCEFRLADDQLLVLADEGQLSQVVHNLVLNAIQAMPGGGTITVASERPAGEPGWVRFSLSDRGTGIPQENLTKIFDPYFSTKDGSGLGLTSCYSIVKKHGGSIAVESVLGQGTTFTVLLPALADESEPAQAVPHCSGNPGEERRILLLDDDPQILEVGQAILEHLGYQAETVSDGTLAVELYHRRREAGQPFAAVILDLTIRGGMGGQETLRALRSLDPEVKAVVSSGYCEDPVLGSCRDHGFCAVLAKPYSAREVGQLLDELLGGTPPGGFRAEWGG